MNNINFSLYVANKCAKRWHLFFGLCIGLISIGLMAYSAVHLIQLYRMSTQFVADQERVIALKKKIADLTQAQEHYAKLVRQIDKIESRIHGVKSPSSIIDASNKACGKAVQMRSCSVQKNKIEMVMHANNTNEPALCVSRLEKCNHFKEVALFSIQTTASPDDAKQQKVVFVVKASIDKKPSKK